MSELPDRHAAVIGINAYGHGVVPLRSAVNDARAIAAALEADHGYTCYLLIDSEATGAEILRLLEETLPGQVGKDGGVLFYFAGHGFELGDVSKGPQGFLLPQDARGDDQTTWLPMDRIRHALTKLTKPSPRTQLAEPLCRHLLVVLDCCYAGSFRWQSTRAIGGRERPLYDSQYKRYLLGTAWQVLTSAAHNEKALDVPGGRNDRDEEGAHGHSPFAQALLRGLAGDADSSRRRHDADGVMTATELHQFIFAELVPDDGQNWPQTPGLWPLRPDNTGEFIFLSPRQERRTLPDPPLDDANNPWLGSKAYGEGDAPLFCGRERVVQELLDRLLNDSRPLLAVVGASGSGKSGLVKAGLLPLLQAPPEERTKKEGAWWVVPLQANPETQLDDIEDLLAEAPPGHRKLLLIDQFEEIFTKCQEVTAQDGFLEHLRKLATGADPARVVLTLQSDFVPRLMEAFADLLAGGLYEVPDPTLEEIREIVEKPARLKALYFEPGELVDELVEGVFAMPGALALLSHVLAELYRQALRRRRESWGTQDRALTRQDLKALGGVEGMVRRLADELLKKVDAKDRSTVARVALRMVSFEDGRVSRRRISRREVEYAESEESVIRKLTEDRLVVADQGYLEPAHDALVHAWPQLDLWPADAADTQRLLRATWRAAVAWEKAEWAQGLLWTEDPRLPQVEAIRGELNLLEGQFVDASRREADERQRRARCRLLAAEARSCLHDRLDRALLLILEADSLGETVEIRRLLFQALEASPRLERVLHGHEYEVLAVAWSPEGSLLASGAESILLWDAAAKPPVGRPLVGPRGKVWSLAWSPDARRLAAGGESGIQLWDVPAEQPQPRRLGPAAAVYAIAWSPDGRLLAAAQDDHGVRLWDLESGQAVGPALTGATDWLTSVAWSPDGRTVAAAGMDKRIRRWDAATGEAIPPPLGGHAEGVMSLAWSPDGRLLASGSLDGTAIVWDPATGKPRARPVDGLIGAVGTVAWRSDSSTLAVGGIDGTLVFWDVATERPRARPAGGQIARLRSIAWSADGQFLASGNGRAVVLWSTATGPRLRRRLELGAAEVKCVKASRDGRFLAAEARDPISQAFTIRRWDAAGGELCGAPFPSLRRRTADLAWTADGGILAAAGRDRTVRRWEVATGRVLSEFRLGGDSSGRLSSLAWTGDGSRLAAGGRDGTVAFWDGANGKPLGPPRPGHDGRVPSLAWTADASTLASGGDDGTVRLWDASSGEPCGAPFAGHQDRITGLAWTGDGRTLASASRDLTIRFWDVPGGRELGEPLDCDSAFITRLAWSSDGRTLASASHDRRILLWDVACRESFAGPFGGHCDTISGLLFSSDDKTLLSISTDGTLMRWDVDPESWRERARRIANRKLTPEEWGRILPDSPASSPSNPTNLERRS